MMKLTKKNKDDTKETQKKGNCGICAEELISDVEEDDEKNIGCDFCPRWFHMKCTEFIGIPYMEAASKEYKCDYCT